jgi:hypothetical protein
MVVHGLVCGMVVYGLVCGMVVYGLVCGMVVHGLVCGMVVYGLVCGMVVYGLVCGMVVYGLVCAVSSVLSSVKTKFRFTTKNIFLRIIYSLFGIIKENRILIKRFKISYDYYCQYKSSPFVKCVSMNY